MWFFCFFFFFFFSFFYFFSFCCDHTFGLLHPVGKRGISICQKFEISLESTAFGSGSEPHSAWFLRQQKKKRVQNVISAVKKRNEIYQWNKQISFRLNDNQIGKKERRIPFNAMWLSSCYNIISWGSGSCFHSIRPTETSATSYKWEFADAIGLLDILYVSKGTSEAHGWNQIRTRIFLLRYIFALQHH